MKASFAILIVTAALAFATLVHAQSHAPTVPEDFAKNHKPPLILSLDGVDLRFVAQWPRTTEYLKPALEKSTNLKKMGMKADDIYSVPWNGDPTETPQEVPSVKASIALLGQIARRDARTFVIVSHSWGSVLAYRAIHDLESSNPNYGNVDLLITLGSPLGEGASPAKLLAQQFKTQGIQSAAAPLRKPLSLKQWSNYWSPADELLSGPIQIARNTEVPHSRLRDHSSYYSNPEFLETFAAEIAVTVAKSANVASPAPQAPRTNDGTSSARADTARSGAAAGPAQILRGLTGRWQGQTSAGLSFVWTVGENGRYEAVYAQLGQEVRRVGRISVASDGSLQWRCDSGQSGTLSVLKEGSGVQILRGTISGRPETFEATQVAPRVVHQTPPSRSVGGTSEAGAPTDTAPRSPERAGSVKDSPSSSSTSASAPGTVTFRFGRDRCGGFTGHFIQIVGDVSETVDLGNRATAEAFVDKGKAFAFDQCRLTENSVTTITVTLRQPGTRGDQVLVEGAYNWVTKPRFTLQGYTNKIADEAEAKRRDEEKERKAAEQAAAAAQREREIKSRLSGTPGAEVSWKPGRHQNCSEGQPVVMPIIGVPDVYIEILGDVPASIDLADHETAKSVLRAGKTVGEMHCAALTRSGNRGVDVGLRKSSGVVIGRFRYGEEAKDYLPAYQNVFAEARQKATQNDLQRRVVDAQKQWEEAFGARYGLKDWIHVAATEKPFFANPFPWKGKVIGFVGEFLQMQAETRAAFKIGSGDFAVVTGVPSTLFKQTDQRVLMAASVQSVTEVSLPVVGRMAVPELRFIGAENHEFPAGWLGMEPVALPPEQILRLSGAFVKQVFPGTAAEKGGLRVGDVIVAINGHRVTEAWDVSNELRMMKPNSTASIKLLRDGKEIAIVATLGQRPATR